MPVYKVITILAIGPNESGEPYQADQSGIIRFQGARHAYMMRRRQDFTRTGNVCQVYAERPVTAGKVALHSTKGRTPLAYTVLHC